VGDTITVTYGTVDPALYASLPVRWQWQDGGGMERETSYLSPAQVWRFTTCEECYRLEYVEHADKIVKPALLVGGAVHEGIERRRTRWLDFSEGYDPEGALQAGADPLERLEDDVTAAVEHLEFDLESHWQNARWENSTSHIALVDWNRMIDGPDTAKDQVAMILRDAIPELAGPDHTWGLEEAEFRVWGLGQPLDAEEEGYYRENYRTPLLPFGVMAYCDASYRRGILGDCKTAQGHSQPSYDHCFQMATYDLPFFAVGQGHRLKLDQFSKAKNPKERYVYWWLSIDRQHVLDRYMQIARRITRCVESGDWQARPNWWCSYVHSQHYVARGDS
jgi:hypothetical protein